MIPPESVRKALMLHDVQLIEKFEQVRQGLRQGGATGIPFS